MKSHPLIERIEPLPDRGSAAGGSRGVDVLILLGYDQTHLAVDRWMLPTMGLGGAGVITAVVLDTGHKHFMPVALGSLGLLALGAVLPTTRIDTETLADAVAYHVPTGRVLFRAVATDASRQRTWALGAGKTQRAQGDASVARAVDALVANLGAQLTAFERSARTSPRFRVVPPSERTAQPR